MSAVQAPERWLNSPRFKKLRAQFSERSRQDFIALAAAWYGTSELFPKQVSAFGKRLELLTEWPAQAPVGGRTPPPPSAQSKEVLAHLEALNHVLALVPGSSVLHLNCGDGGLAWHLPANIFYEGWAFSPEDVETAKRHVPQHVFQRLDLFASLQKIPRPRYDLVLITLDNPALFSYLQELRAIPNLAFPSCEHTADERTPKTSILATCLPRTFASFLLQFAGYARKSSGMVLAAKVTDADYDEAAAETDKAWFPSSAVLNNRAVSLVLLLSDRSARVRLLLEDDRSAHKQPSEMFQIRVGSSTDDPRPLSYSEVQLTVGTPKLPYRFKRGQTPSSLLKAGVTGPFLSFGSASEMAIWQLQNPAHVVTDLKVWGWTHIVLDFIQRGVDKVTEADLMAYFTRFEVELPRLTAVDPQLLAALTRRVQEGKRLHTPYPQRMSARGRYFILGPHTPLLKDGKRFKVAFSKPDFIPGSPPTLYIEEEV